MKRVRKYANIREAKLPRTRVVFDTLPVNVQDKCVVKIGRLRALGHQLRRPEADLLRNGIYELRIGREGINYRILYFFRGGIAAILAHGLVKEREVPDRDIRVALERKRLFEQDPDAHTYLEQ